MLLILPVACKHLLPSFNQTEGLTFHFLVLYFMDILFIYSKT